MAERRVHSTARIGAVRIRDKFGRDLVERPVEPNYRQLVSLEHIRRARQELEALPAGLRELAVEAEFLTEKVFEITGYGS